MLGIDASAKPAETLAQITRIAHNTAKLRDVTVSEEDILLDDRFHAGIYGIPDESTVDAMRLGASLEGMITDPVYEGKSLAGLIHLVSSGEIGRDSTVLYAHLGGQPALNAYSSLFEV